MIKEWSFYPRSLQALSEVTARLHKLLVFAWKTNSFGKMLRISEGNNASLLSRLKNNVLNAHLFANSITRMPRASWFRAIPFPILGNFGGP